MRRSAGCARLRFKASDEPGSTNPHDNSADGAVRPDLTVARGVRSAGPRGTATFEHACRSCVDSRDGRFCTPLVHESAQGAGKALKTQTWLPGEDSNLNSRLQRPLSYH